MFLLGRLPMRDGLAGSTVESGPAAALVARQRWPTVDRLDKRALPSRLRHGASEHVRERLRLLRFWRAAPADQLRELGRARFELFDR